MQPEQILDGLTDDQCTAVTHRGGPVAVLAGPGTGKTRVLTRRIAHLVATGDADPARVLALTFTNKAAGEMRERLTELLGHAGASAVNAFTFNAFGLRLLTRFGDLAGIKPDAVLIDSAQRKRLFRELIQEHNLFPEMRAHGLDAAVEISKTVIKKLTAAGHSPRTASRRVAAQIDKLERAEPTGPEAETQNRADLAESRRLAEACRLWSLFDKACRQRGLMSFDQQVRGAVELLASHRAALDIARGESRVILVDEFQDLDLAQLELLTLLAPPESTPEICVVGDDDQAIYGFRGADDRTFQRFALRWGAESPVKIVELSENFRSAQPVLSVASEIITRAHDRFSPDKTVRRAGSLPSDVEGEGASFVRTGHFSDLGPTIAAMILRARAEDPTLEFAKIAVIARGHTDLERIRDALELERIPVLAQRPPSPRDEPAVRDVFAWTEALCEPDQAWPWVRLLRRPPIGAPADVIASWQRRLGKPGDDDPPAYLTRLVAALRGDPSADPELVERIARMESTRAELADLTAEHPADAVVEAIIHRTGVASRELLDPRAHAARVSALVALLRFVRERTPRLESPNDLDAFRRYDEDLDADDRRFEVVGIDGEKPEPEDDPEDAGAQAGDPAGVRLITAHSSKGLEFDTVFVPRVENHGYPSRARTDETPMPEWLTRRDGAADTRTAAEAHEDEERRLFYVACTRAERRLVLLGKVPKKSSSLNFAVELLDASALAPVREHTDILDEAAAEGLTLGGAGEGDLTGWQLADARRQQADAARSSARRAAAAALDRIDRPGATDDDIRSAADACAEAARRLAVVAQARHDGNAPDWATADQRELAERVARAEESAASGALDLRPLTGPLELSYTQINAVERCPRCFYVERILKLPGKPGAALSFGSVAHAALERFAKAIRDAETGDDPSLTAPGLDDLLAFGDAAFDAAWPPSLPGAESERAALRTVLTGYLEHLHDPTAEILEVETAHRIPFEHDGMTHTITAKIDRIERLPSGRIRVIDFKTGGAGKTLLAPDAKKDLQLGIYADAARAFFGDEELDGTAEYWLLRTCDRGSVDLAALVESSAKRHERISKAVHMLLHGPFERGRDCSGACDILDLT